MSGRRRRWWSNTDPELVKLLVCWDFIYVDPMFFYCWASVADARPTITRKWIFVNIISFAGYDQVIGGELTVFCQGSDSQTNIQGDVIIRMARHSNQVVIIPADTNKAYRLFNIGPSFDMLTLRQCWLNRFMIYDSERWLMFTTCCTGTYISAPDTLVKWVCLRHGEVYVYKQRFFSNELA